MAIITQLWLQLDKTHTLVVFALQTPSSLLCLRQKETNKIFLFISHFPEAAEFWMQQFLNWNGCLCIQLGGGCCRQWRGTLCFLFVNKKRQRWVGEDTWAWVEAVKREEVGIVRPKRTRAIIISWELCMKGAEWIVRSKHWGQQMLRGGGVPLHCQLL